jgi:pyruvate kinase
MDVVRINFPTAKPRITAAASRWPRTAAESEGRVVGVLGDLQGPKIRIARFADSQVELNEGDAFILDAGTG